MIALENMRSRFNSAAGLQSQGYSDVCELPLAVAVAAIGRRDHAPTRRTPSSPTATCSSRSPTRCSAPPPTPRTCSRRPGCGGPTSTVAEVRDAPRVPRPDHHPAVAEPDPHRCPAAASRTSGRGCPSRCSPRPTSPRTSSSPTASRPRCCSCSRRSTPTERAVFVLREVFDFPYDEIAAAVDKTPAAVRQIAHRARSHVDARRPRETVEQRASGTR